MRKNKTRTYVTLSGIVLSSVLLFCLGFGFSTIRRYRFDKINQEIGGFHVRYDGLKGSDYQKLLQHDKLKKVRFVGLMKTVKEHNLNIALYETNGLELSSITLVEGTYPLKEKEVLLPETVKNIYGEIGNFLNVDGREYQIIGYYYVPILSEIESKFYTYKEKPSYTKNYQYNITFYDIENVMEQIFELGQYLELPIIDKATHKGEVINNDLLYLYGDVTSNTAAIDLLILVLLLSCLSVACMFVIYNAFAISINEQKKLYGILASIGATPKQCFLFTFLEATIYVLIALPIGFLLSIFLMNGFVIGLNYLVKDISLITYQFCIYPIFVFLSLLFLISMIYLSAFIPGLTASKITPMQIIRENDIWKKPKRKVKKSILGIEVSLARRNYICNKRKYQIAILSIVLGTVLFLTASTFSKQYYPNGVFVRDTMLPDVSFVMASSDSEIKQIYSELLKVSKNSNVIIKKRLPLRNGSICVSVLDDASYQSYQQKLKLRNDVPILLDWYVYQNIMGTKKEEGKVLKEIPAEITLFYYDKKEVIGNIKIEDFYVTTVLPNHYYLENQKNCATLFLSDTMWKKYQKKLDIQNDVFSNAYEFQIDGKDFISIHYFVKKLSSLYVNQIDYYQNQAFDEYQESQNRLVSKMILIGVVFFCLIISVTGIMNTLSASMKLRRKEFAIMKSIGMSEKSFYKMIYYEGFFIGIFSLIVGISIFLSFLFLANVILTQISTEFYILPQISDFLIITVIVFVTVFFSIYYATRKIKKDNIIDVLKNEEY